MKNMKVSMKLIVSFLIVAVFSAAVGITGIFGMTRMDAAATTIYENQMSPLAYLSNLTTQMQLMRVNMREYTIGVASKNVDQIENTRTAIADVNESMTENFDSYAPTMTNPEGIRLFNEARAIFDGEYQDYLQKIYEYAKAGDLDGCIRTLNEAKADTEIIINNLDRCLQIRLELASDVNDYTDVLARTLLTLIIVILVIAVAVAVFFAFYISGLISKPLVTLTAFMNKAGTTGDISLSQEDIENISKFSQTKDEIGQCIGSTAGFVKHLDKIAVDLGTIANGDLTAQIDRLSEKDVMGVALQKMADSLNTMFTEIRTASDQVSSGAGQVSQGAQQLASGSSEQAASIEEFSASLNELQEKTNNNAENSIMVRDVNNEMGKKLENSIRSMNEMLEAMKAIDESSGNITKVIKVIDDIAFQTNILALNAAVEAARAGQHGKGFAVVADEVRNLASKSAAAAKETAAFIEGSSQRVKEGNQIVVKTNADLGAAAESAQESTRLVEEVTAASSEQARSIHEINQRVEQITTVVQANAATAEESAAASEEMSAQAVVLDEIVARFKLRQADARGGMASYDNTVGSKNTYPDIYGFSLAHGKY